MKQWTHRQPHKGMSSGFTLIEMMVVLVITGILVAVSAPSLGNFVRNAQLSSAGNSLISAISATRFEAMKRGKPAMLVPLQAGDWSSGWRLYVSNSGASASFDSGTDITVTTMPSLPSYIRVSQATGTANAAAPYVRFNASGFPVSLSGALSNVTLRISRTDVSPQQQNYESRDLKIAITGRVRMCRTSDSDC